MNNEYDKALQIADKYLNEKNAYDWDALYMKASIFSTPMPEYSDYHSAIGIIITALNYLNKPDVNHWISSGGILESCGIYAEAERYYRKGLEMDPTNYVALLSLAMLHHCPGTQISTEEAITLLETAISSKPNEWNAYHHLAAVLQNLGDKKKAKVMYHSALLRLPGSENEAIRPELEKHIKLLEEESRRMGS